MGIQKHEIPDSFHTEILRRFMDERAIKDLYDSYRSNFKHSGGSIMRTPSESDIKIARLVPKNGVSGTARMLGIHPYKVDSALNRVARYQFAKSLE